MYCYLLCHPLCQRHINGKRIRNVGMVVQLINTLGKRNNCQNPTETYNLRMLKSRDLQLGREKKKNGQQIGKKHKVVRNFLKWQPHLIKIVLLNNFFLELLRFNQVWAQRHRVCRCTCSAWVQGRLLLFQTYTVGQDRDTPTPLT